jgi:leucyl-tRNA synthetase
VTLLLAPITPHISHELWQQLGHADLGDRRRLAEVDERAGAGHRQLVVQVNGKLRGHVDMPAAASREEVEAAARANSHRRPDHPQGHRGAGKLVNIVAN